MKKQKKFLKIGIWGFGIVGKTALRYFQQKQYQIEVFDSRELNNDEKKMVYSAGANLKKDINLFLETNDKILASPGINLNLYKKYKKKWITELDIIQENFKKPIIAITGTVGKTTITHLLSKILKKSGFKIFTGGNIGTGMLELLMTPNKNIDIAVLEVSSFQLEQCKIFAPTIAIWTNFYENHLDRHKTLKNYFEAKKNIFSHQKKGQHAIIPLGMAKKINIFEKRQNSFYFFSKKVNVEKKSVSFPLFTIKQQRVMRLTSLKNQAQCNETMQGIFNFTSKLTFSENGLILSIATMILEETFKKSIKADFNNTPLPPHRLEYVKNNSGIIFYNDSKSTTPASTFAAVKKLSKNPILLLLGGLSKGINRGTLLKKIKTKVKVIYAFGAEANEIKHEAIKNNIKCNSFKSLENAFLKTCIDAKHNDIILLSPAGSSFDLFKNYKERGELFKKLVANIKKRTKNDLY